MPQSLCKLYVHLIFHIKNVSPRIREQDAERIHAYLGQLVNATGCTDIRVGGVGDHVHILFALSKDTTLSFVVEEIKRNSSRWIKTLGIHYRLFSWQGGYAAFSVSQSVISQTLQYISNQKEHHKKRSFEEEYLDFLRLYQIEYNKDYVFRD